MTKQSCVLLQENSKGIELFATKNDPHATFFIMNRSKFQLIRIYSK
jgi:hypothetical protein